MITHKIWLFAMLFSIRFSVKIKKPNVTILKSGVKFK